MKILKQFTSFALAMLMLAGCFALATTASDSLLEYPELLITEIGVDQYGDAANADRKNIKYADSSADKDPYEFIEIVNNSDRAVNVYDYMLAYGSAAPTDTEVFERSVQKYTPFYPGEDWTDGNYTSYASNWKGSSIKRPVNPAYGEGVIAAGEVFVAWIYNGDSHALHATLEEFRSFWRIDSSVKVFILDGNTQNKMNFSLDNEKTAAYAIIHSSERFSKRRSSDATFSPQNTNTHHNYQDITFEGLEEVISWAVVDYTTSPLNGTAATSKDNYTISYQPYAKGVKAENGYRADAFASKKRVHLQDVNTYAESTVGKLNDAQVKALKGTVTDTVRTASVKPVVINEIKNRPSLIITEISSDNRTDIPQNTNPEKGGANSDPYECFEVYNNSAETINIYDYMIGYQGSGAKNVSTYFERLVQEYTPIFPGADWIDAPYTAYDAYWKDANITHPVNPAYSEGELKPGDVAVIWAYSKDSHNVHAQIEHFRSFWSIPEGVKVFLLDANSSDRDKNFNIKNSDTGTYVIMKSCDKYPIRRGDDETFNTEGGDRLSVYYDLHGGRSYETEPEIISWAVICYNLYDPLYSFYIKNKGGSATNNYTLVYTPYNGEPIFGNGFLTVSIPSQKRMHLLEPTTTAHIGVLTDAQKQAIAKAQTIK